MKIKNSIKILVIILFLINLSMSLHRHQKIYRRISEKTNGCQDPGEVYKEDLLNQYEILLKNYEETMLKTKQFEFGFSKSFLKNSSKSLFDNSQCRYSKRNTTNLAKKSKCPWKNVIEYRENKYPHYVTTARCNCETCNQLGDSQMSSFNFKCMPVLKATPVLIREKKCGPDGYFIWTPSVEEINLSCFCGIKNNLNPV